MRLAALAGLVRRPRRRPVAPADALYWLLRAAAARAHRAPDRDAAVAALVDALARGLVDGVADADGNDDDALAVARAVDAALPCTARRWIDGFRACARREASG